MAAGDYVVGLLFLTGTWGPSIGAAVLLVNRRLPQLGGTPRLLAVALLATSTSIAAHLLPGAAGLLSRTSALVAAFLLLAAAWRFVKQVPGAERAGPPTPARESGPVSWALAGVGGAVLAVWALAESLILARTPSEQIDALTFQLPNIGRWMQDGTLWSVNQYVPLQAHGNYPHNGDLLLLSVMQPFGSDAFARLVNLPFYVLAGLAVYAMACELGAPRATAALAGMLVVSLPVVVLASFPGTKTDPAFYAAFGSGLLFLLRHLRLGARADLLLAGLGFGVALGTKWYGVTTIAVVLLAWAGAALIVRKCRPRAVLRTGGALAALTALGGGFWFVRNTVLSGSPLFPQAVPLLADTPRDFVRECVGFSIADYVGDPDVWRDYLLPAWRDALGLGGPVIAASWAVACIVAVRGKRSNRVPAGVWLLVAATAGLTLVYAVTPFTALGIKGQPVDAAPNVRYLVPGLITAAAVGAYALGRLGRAGLVAEALVLLAVLDGVRRGFEVPVRNLVAATALLLLASSAAFLVVRLRARYPRRRVAVALTLGAILVAGAAGFDRQRKFSENRYVRADPAVQSLLSGSHRVALAGTWTSERLPPVWPSFGPQLDNRVDYLGEFRGGLLNEYRDPTRWRRAVERGRYDLVAVGRGGYPRGCRVPGSETDDDAWARAAGYEQIARVPDLTVYRVR